MNTRIPEAINLWNQGLDSQEIAKKMQVNRPKVVKWLGLQGGTELGDVDAVREMRRHLMQDLLPGS